MGSAPPPSAEHIDKIFTKELVATNVTFGQLATNKLCVGSVYVTEAQFMAMVTTAAVGAPSAGWLKERRRPCPERTKSLLVGHPSYR
jgi:hypothetical protein